MKAKVLSCYYPGESGYEIVRVYLEPHFEQAAKDYSMTSKYCTDKFWKLEEVELFTLQNP